MARENRAYLQRCIRVESEHVASYAEQVERLSSLLECNMARYRSAQYLLSQKGLPVELWRKIFQLTLIHDRGHQSIILSQVCRFWRIVSIEYPDLWARTPIASKSTRLAMSELERFLDRTATSHHLHLSFRSSSLHFRISAFDVEISTPLIRNHPHNVHGQDVAYDMHDLSHIDSLEIEGSSTSNSPRLFLTSWGISYLHCREILPVLAPSAANSITKLTLNYRKWPDSFRLEQFLRLTFAVEELNLNCRHNTGVQSMPSEYVILPKLRCLRTTVEILLNNLTALTQSPYLRRLGFYPTETTPPTFSGLLNQIEERMPRFRQSITNLEIHTLTDSTFQFQLGCSLYLGLFRGVRVLELIGPSSSEVLGLLKMYLDGEIEQIQREWLTGLTELVLRNCDVKAGLLMGIVAPTDKDGRATLSSAIKRLTLVHCTGLTRMHCDFLKRRLEKLDVFY
jgi:hypothetical protein